MENLAQNNIAPVGVIFYLLSLLPFAIAKNPEKKQFIFDP